MEIFEKQKTFFGTKKTYDYNFRIAMLKKLKLSIINYQDEILEALKNDLNKSNTEAIMCEVWFSLQEIDDLIKHLKKWMKPKKVKTTLVNFPGKSYKLYTPLGLNLIISPWNYPFQLTICPLAASIAAGNTAIVKPSKNSKYTTAIIKKLVSTTFDEEYIYLFDGDRNQADILLNENFDHIFFTGSTYVGRHILSCASKNLTKVSLELGGKSPCIVDETANLDIAGKRIAFGKITNSGQTCVAPDYIICHSSIKNKLVDKISTNFKEMVGSDAINNPDYCKLISLSHYEKVKDLLRDQKILYGGKTNDDLCKIEPTIIDSTIDSKLMQEEIFGPIFPIITYENIDEIEKIVNRNPNPLAFYLFSNNKKTIDYLTKKINFGGCSINDTLSHLIGGYLPFGGVKESGHGHYHGFSSFETFSHQKSIFKKSTHFDINIKYPPYDDKKKKLIRKLFLPKKQG